MHEPIQDELIQAMKNVIDKGSFILGPSVLRFEQKFAAYTRSTYGIGVASGTDALVLSLKAMGIREGDEVVTVSNTYVSTVDAILRNGAKPVLVDIDPETFNMDLNQVQNAITSKTKAVLPVHLFGQMVDMKHLREICDKRNLLLFEDACQAHGSEYAGIVPGQLSEGAAYSFYPGKNLGGFGDAGLVTTNSVDLYDKLLLLRNYGQEQKYHHEIVGFNSRLDELQAAILEVKLAKLEGWNEERRKAALEYTKLLDGIDDIVSPMILKDAKHVFHLYVIKTKKRDLVQEQLAKSNIQTQIHYPIPIHKQRAYIDKCEHSGLGITERLSSEILSLPMFPGITYEEQERVVQTIKSVLSD